MYTAAQVDKAVNWEGMPSYATKQFEVFVGHDIADPVMCVKQGVDCDHDTCYDTHTQEWVVRVGVQHFLKRSEYSSQAGTIWIDGLTEVETVEVPRTEWTEVKRVPLTAKFVEKAIEDSFGRDHGVRYREAATSRNPIPEWEDLDLFGWKDFVECVEGGTLMIPKVSAMSIAGFVKPDDFEDLDSTELECPFTVGGQVFVKQGTWVSHDGAYWEGDVFEAKVAQKTVNHWVRSSRSGNTEAPGIRPRGLRLFEAVPDLLPVGMVGAVRIPPFAALVAFEAVLGVVLAERALAGGHQDPADPPVLDAFGYRLGWRDTVEDVQEHRRRGAPAVRDQRVVGHQASLKSMPWIPMARISSRSGWIVESVGRPTVIQ